MADLGKVSNELHKPVIRKFQRRKVYANDVNDVWGADLADLQMWSSSNDGYRYILTVIDVLSKYAWAVPLKDKTGSTVTAAFEKLFNKAVPNNIWVDMGSEFYNQTFKKLLKEEKIGMYSTYGEHKSVVIERFNRTLKQRMYRNFTTNNNREWVDMLPILIKEYNDTVHRTIKLKPKDAIKPKNRDELLFNFNNSGKRIKYTKPKLKVNDFVRISRIKGTFEKGFDANWSLEIFRVAEVLETKPVTYHIIEYDKSPIEGSFYEQELQKTEESEVFLVEKVIKQRTVKGKKQLYVKWLGWPEKYNAWIDEGQTVTLKK